jgi:serpin B
MLILLPDDREGLDQVIGRITTDLLRACAALRPARPIDLYLPKFRLVGSTIRLGNVLESLGMKTAFDLPTGSANFDRIAPRKPDDYLAISEVFHQTFIAVDEQGTEASAATAVAMLALSVVPATPPQPIEVRVDHPFFFAIQERSTGICLFLGSVSDPR